MKWIYTAAIIFMNLSACSQSTSNNNIPKTQLIGGRCEGCEAIFETPIPFDQLNYIDTLPDFDRYEQKLLLTGTVYQVDGKTPAKDVVLYVYHTDPSGIYPRQENDKGWAQRHGYIRGWIKTNSKGEYLFYTFRPASYPNSTQPQHVHITAKEQDKNEYYIDDFLFADDPHLQKENKNQNPRGGNGVVQPEMNNGISTARRDIILGKNIPDYPVNKLH